MSVNGEDDHLTFTQKFSSGDYLFVYAAGENNVVSLIQTNTYSEDTPDEYMSDQDVVDAMLNGMLEAMELKNGKICDDSYYSCGGNMKWIMTLNLCLMYFKKSIDNTYIYGSLKQPMTQKIL